MNNERLRVVISGLAVTYPFGGVFWDYVQYALGLHRLGHDVLYLEDNGYWLYSPREHTFVKDGAANAAHFADQLGRLAPELSERWAYCDPSDEWHGRSWTEVAAFCESADIFLNISAASRLRDEYRTTDRFVLIDSDPMYTQASVPDFLADSIDEESADRLRELLDHQVHLTFGLNIGADDCLVPADLFAWQPTIQPVVVDCFEHRRVPVRSRRDVLTTVGSWEPRLKPLVVDGREYSGKRHELERFIDLPQRASAPLELALSGEPPAELKKHGWRVRDAWSVSSDPIVYGDYLADSLAEFSVAKHAYVASRSGWFSCRSACYLALGVPVIVQDTGFSKYLPCGEGLLAFSTAEEALAAIDSVRSDPERHAEAAIEIVHRYFASDIVLGDLIDRALTAEPANPSTSSEIPAEER